MGWNDYSQKLKIYQVEELMRMRCMGIFILIYHLKNSHRDSVKNYTDIGAEWNCTMISRNVYQHIFGS